MVRANDAVLFVGRLLMAALFLPSGIAKALDFTTFAASLADKGLPYAEVWAAAAVAVEIIGSVALVLGFLPTWTAIVLIGFVVAATGTSHRYWEFAETAYRSQQIHFFKNVGVVAGLLFYAAAGPGAWSLSGLPAGKSATRQPEAPATPAASQAA